MAKELHCCNCYFRGCESETDTEEFEKVCQSPNDNQRQSSEGVVAASSTQTSLRRPDTISNHTSMERISVSDIGTVTDYNSETAAEVETLKGRLKEAYSMYVQGLRTLKQDMDSMKAQSVESLTGIAQVLAQSHKQVCEESETKAQQMIKRAEQEAHHMKIKYDEKCAQVEALLAERDELQKTTARLKAEEEEQRLQHMRDRTMMEAQFEMLEKSLKEERHCREQIIKEARDNLNRDYNNKMDGLKSRYKLMTSIEHSPSESSLEKIDRGDLYELVEQEAATTVPRDAGGVSIRGGGGLSGSLTKLLSGSSPRSPSSRNQDFLKRILDDKENQMDNMRAHNDLLTKEIDRMGQTILKLTESIEARDSTVQDQLEVAERERYRLVQELEMEKSRRSEMEQSFSTFPRM